MDPKTGLGVSIFVSGAAAGLNANGSMDDDVVPDGAVDNAAPGAEVEDEGSAKVNGKGDGVD